jgi:hypothetical protein
MARDATESQAGEASLRGVRDEESSDLSNQIPRLRLGTTPKTVGSLAALEMMGRALGMTRQVLGTNGVCPSNLLAAAP